MRKLSRVSLVVGIAAGALAGCGDAKPEKKLDLQKETLVRLDAGPDAAAPEQPRRNTPPTNLPPEPPPKPPVKPPANHAPL